MPCNTALLIWLLVAACACCSLGHASPLGRISGHRGDSNDAQQAAPFGRRQLAAAAAKPKPAPLLPICAAAALFDKKKTALNCQTFLDRVQDFTVEMISGIPAAQNTTVNITTNSTIIQVVNTAILETVGNSVLSSLTDLATILEVAVNKTLWGNLNITASGSGSRRRLQQTGDPDFEQLITDVGRALQQKFMKDIEDLTAAAGWNDTVMSIAMNARIVNDLTLPANSGAPMRAAFNTAFRNVTALASDPLTKSILLKVATDLEAVAAGLVQQGVGPGGVITNALLNATTGAGGAVSDVALSKAQAALSEALAAPNGTIVAALADAASALSAAVAARVAAGLQAPGSGVAAAFEAAAADVIAASTAAGGALTVALLNSSSPLSLAVIALIGAEAGSLTSAFRAAAVASADASVAASVDSAAGSFFTALADAQGPLRALVDSRASSASGLNASTVDAAIKDGLTGAGGIFATQLKTNGSAVNSALAGIVAAAAKDVIDAALSDGGSIWADLSEPGSPCADNAIARAAASFAGNSALSGALETRALAFVETALSGTLSSTAIGKGVSALITPLATAAVAAAAANSTGISALADDRINFLRPTTTICGSGLQPIKQTTTTPATVLATAALGPASISASSPACAAKTYFIDAYCSLSGPSGVEWYYSLAQKNLDYSAKQISCTAVLAASPPTPAAAQSYSLTATAICCPDA